MRGTGHLEAGGKKPRRFIPACAGNSFPKSATYVETAVHPRVCGEQTSDATTGSPDDGSSPRVRGTVPSADPPPARRRFIPACAGNSPRPFAARHFLPVHPRVCGEQSRVSFMYAVIPRFIPACAGNRLIASIIQNIISVHPRVCGEQESSRRAPISSSGSSPRVRGTVAQKAVTYILDRFIPACAGNSSAPRSVSPPQTVHPRVCGEQTIFQAVRTASVGSSPRVRGTVTRNLERDDG